MAGRFAQGLRRHGMAISPTPTVTVSFVSPILRASLMAHKKRDRQWLLGIG
jgi:hypothetical protein